MKVRRRISQNISIRMATEVYNTFLLSMEQSLKNKDCFPDYVVQLQDGTIWLIETKGRESRGQSKNIDVQTENKLEVFKQFANKHNYKFGFVRDKNDDLYINNTEYTDDMSNNSWFLLEEVS